MGRKKKRAAKPFCWYCNREFEDEKILIQHQKAKHFKCHICNKKLFTGPGLAIHCMQVHKETIDKIPGAVPGRDSVDVEVYGMDGIPQEYDGGGEPRAKKPATASTGAPGIPQMPGVVPPMPGYPQMQQQPMIAANPYTSYYGMMPGQFPPMPSGSMPPRSNFPSMPTAAVPRPFLPHPSAAPVHIPSAPQHVPPMPTAFSSAFQQPQLPNHVNHLGPPKDSVGLLQGASSSRAVASKTRIVMPDESISLEEHMANRIESLHSRYAH